MNEFLHSQVLVIQFCIMRQHVVIGTVWILGTGLVYKEIHIIIVKLFQTRIFLLWHQIKIIERY
jgi:hypothetical protein